MAKQLDLILKANWIKQLKNYYTVRKASEAEQLMENSSGDKTP
jgi:hypothetical protein